MRRNHRLGFVGPLGLSLTAVVAAYGTFGAGVSGASPTAKVPNGAYAPGGTASRSALGSPPRSLDPQLGYSSESEEADWLVYTPWSPTLWKAAVAGDTLIPGLASALPTVSDGGLTYTATLRKGLKYSNGVAIARASDFPYTIELDLSRWSGDSFYTTTSFWCGGLPGGQGESHQRHQRRRHHRTNHHPLDFPLRGVRQRPRLSVSGPSAQRDGHDGPVDIPAPRRRRLHDHARSPECVVHSQVEPPVRQLPHRGHSSWLRQCRAGHYPDQPCRQRTPRGPGRAQAARATGEFDWGDVTADLRGNQIKDQARDRYTPETLAATCFSG